jgi:hypothetical protein
MVQTAIGSVINLLGIWINRCIDFRAWFLQTEIQLPFLGYLPLITN